MVHQTQTEKTKIPALTHPDYQEQQALWSKYRTCYLGGSLFVDRYLRQFSNRETIADYVTRKAITPPSTHAKSSINDIANGIFQRMIDVSRLDGSPDYMKAVQGEGAGVDREGSSMNTFMGVRVAPWLMAIGKVGIFIDKGETNPNGNVRETRGNHPYLYTYQAEDIRSWAFDDDNELQAVLLRDHDFVSDSEFGLPEKRSKRYRLLTRTNEGTVRVQFFKEDGAPVEEVILNLKRIPFVILELNQSLMTDIADYQIAIMNMNSSDVNYSLKSNYPFYTEQYDPRADMSFLRSGANEPNNSIITLEDGEIINDGVAPNTGGTAELAKTAQDKNADAGPTKGRRYSKDTERPGYIHPSPEPLMASMEKQGALKDDIRTLIGLALSSLKPGRASAESKGVDKEGLEAGLACVASVLEYSERQIAVIWDEYQRTDSVAVITYPEDYSLQSRADRLAEAERLMAIAPKIASQDLQKQVQVRVSELLVDQTTTTEQFAVIANQINESKIADIDPEHLYQDVENGLCTAQTASMLRGYDKDEAPKAQGERAVRLAVTAIAQTSVTADGAEIVEKAEEVAETAMNSARGTSADPTDESGKDEKAQAKEENS